MKYPQLVSMPSAVSDWLEEQLEARGIDSEVYTRYILSLLHVHTLDVIYPEEDLPITQLKKNGGRGAAFQKRVRRAGGWWRHADADAEQIKRSAAVECLMSAAEQNCEIESLVDELCEKLKEVNSESEHSDEINQAAKINKEPPKQRKISPKELAEKYYAAFPPLNQKEENSYLTSNINLVVGKWPSPEKSLNNIDLIAAQWTSSGSPKKTKRKPKRQPYETMKSTSRPGQSRNRFGYKKAHCVRALTREMADNKANWEFVYNNNNNNNYKMNEQCLDSFVPTMTKELPDYFKMDENDFPVQWMQHWMAEAENSNQDSGENYLQTNVTSEPQFIPVYPSSIWSSTEPSNGWAEDERSTEKSLVDRAPGTGGRVRSHKSQFVREYWSLEDEEEEETAIRQEYQRSLDEEEECAIKMEYERPFVEEVKVRIGGQWAVNTEERAVQIGGRWSTKMEQPNEPISQDALNFGLVKPNDNKSHDDLLDFNMQNEANSLLENISNRDFTPLPFRNFQSLPIDIWRDWNDPDVINMPFSENECLFDVQTMSLMKINHHKERSAFGEYVRPTIRNNESLLPMSGPYSRPFGRPLKGPNMPAKVVPAPQVPQDGMWESPLVLFRPIKTPLPKPEKKEEPCKKYQDGATFAITSSLDKVEFKRSSSGTLYLETECGDCKKYFEYQWQPPSDDSVKLPRMRALSHSDEFKLKFWVSKNDKASQTEDQTGLLTLAQSLSEMEDEACRGMESMDFGKGSEISEEENSKAPIGRAEKCAQCGGLKSDNCKDIPKVIDPEDCRRSECVVDLAEVVWKDSEENCKFCNGKHQWPNFIQKFDVNWDAETLKDIWEGTGMCRPCPQNVIKPPLVETTSKLREEIKEDAERLMSDLSSVQQAFSDSSRLADALFKTNVAPTDRKRRHSHVDNDFEMWSFATRLQEDCLINLSTLPTRRSVTL